MRWFFSPLMIVAGIALMKYAVDVTNRFTGSIDFAEKYLRFIGGTFGWWKLLGLFMAIFGLAWLTGVLHYDPNSQFELPR